MPKAAQPVIILITAGEPSGDRLGAALMAALKAKRKGLKFIGIGGPEMAKQGLKSLVPISQLAVMGLLEVLPAIPRILTILGKLKALAEQQKPSLILTIDSHDFSSRLAKKLKFLGVPHIHYNAPKVWAWRQSRAKKLKDIYTHLLAVFPFEPPFFKNYGIPTTYVGHPATTALATFKTPTATHLSLALLPGSRTSEITTHWPLMLATYRRLKKLLPQLTATLAVPNQKALTLCQKTASWSVGEGVHVVQGEARFTALSHCRAALAKSGTNNLEIALLGLPAVVCYRMNPVTHFLAKYLIKVPYISLPNIILNRCIYPEFIQSAAKEENLSRALYPLLTQDKSRTHQTKLLEKLHQAMATPKPPAEMAAEVVLKYLPK